MGVTILTGEYICIKFEQQEIKIFENLIGSKPQQNKYKDKIVIEDLDKSEVIELKELKEIRIDSIKYDW